MNPETNNTTVINDNRPHPAANWAGIVFVIILLLLALYLYGARVADNNSVTDDQTVPTATSDSDELADIEADFEVFSPESLDSEGAEIESTLEAELTQ